MSDINDILKGLNPEPVIEEEVVETEQSDGDVEQVIETPEPDVTETVEAPVAEVKEEPVKENHSVPITALLDEREKKQQLKQDNERLQAELERLKAERQPKVEVPDFETDPIGHQQTILQELQQAQINMRLENSLERAKVKYGEEEAITAGQWAWQQVQEDPSFGQRMERLNGDPFENIVAAYRKDKLFNDYAADPKAFAERLMKEHGLVQPVEVQTEMVIPETPVLPTGTIADMPSSGKTKIEPVGSAFDALVSELKTKGK